MSEKARITLTGETRCVNRIRKKRSRWKPHRVRGNRFTEIDRTRVTVRIEPSGEREFIQGRGLLGGANRASRGSGAIGCRTSEDDRFAPNVTNLEK